MSDGRGSLQVTEYAGSEQGILLPFYLVIDVSYSMSGKKLAAAAAMLPEVADALARNPILSDKTRFGLIDFSDDARVVMELCDLGEQTSLPALKVRGGTNFGAAFRLLRRQIETDVLQLRADRFRVYRPAVFFLSDGEPTDEDWEDAFEELKSAKWYPLFVPFGVEDADRDIMRLLVHPLSKSKLYMASDGSQATAAIKAMTEVLISSVLASGYSVSQGGQGHILPGKEDLPDGIDVEDDWLS
jgi:uncharacterized protein YegL